MKASNIDVDGAAIGVIWEALSNQGYYLVVSPMLLIGG
jgi:hypothetical protein